MSHLRVDYFLSEVKYTLSNAIAIVTYEISYNIYKNLKQNSFHCITYILYMLCIVKFIPLYNIYFVYVIQWN